MNEELNDIEIEPDAPPVPAEPLPDDDVWGEATPDEGAEPLETESDEEAGEPADEETEPEPTEEDRDDHRVKLKDHIKLRERAQKAERERDEILRQLAERAERERDEALAKLRQVEDRAVGSEVAMAENPQYQTITRAAINAKLISAADRQAILAAANPAQKLYEISKSKLTGWLAEQGLNAGAEAKPEPEKSQGADKPKPAEQPADELDDEIEALVFGKGKQVQR